MPQSRDLPVHRYVADPRYAGRFEMDLRIESASNGTVNYSLPLLFE